MKLEVLVTTTDQSDFGKYARMNLQTDAVFANQTDKNAYAEAEMGGRRARMISTDTRGLSRNRNLALAHASPDADYLLFADDDLVFVDGYERLVLGEFEKHPEAETIKFNVHNLSATRKINMRRIERFEKATRRNMSASGVWGLAVRQDVLKKYGLSFHENFGIGCENYCGEDTIFLMQMLSKKIKLYRSPVDIAGIDQTESAWFRGFDERYFTVAGTVLGTLYPRLSYLLAIRSALKASVKKKRRLGFWKILTCYYRGIRKHV